MKRFFRTAYRFGPWTNGGGWGERSQERRFLSPTGTGRKLGYYAPPISIKTASPTLKDDFACFPTLILFSTLPLFLTVNFVINTPNDIEVHVLYKKCEIQIFTNHYLLWSCLSRSASIINGFFSSSFSILEMIRKKR
jgi:hypothetical protein